MSSDPKQDYKTFGVLIGAFVASLILGHISTSPGVIALIFAIAALKAYLVLNNFVQLKREPRFVKVLVVGLVLVLVALYLGLVPDIVYGSGTLVDKS
jgi:ABC-type xylose transport system permease subunit